MAKAGKPKCPGYERKNLFTTRCRHCDVLSSGHAPVELDKAKKMPAEWAKLERGYMRWSKEVWNTLTSDLLPMLEYVKKAWRFIQNCPETAHFEFCTSFLTDVTFIPEKPRLGCCYQMIVAYNKVESLVQQIDLKDKACRWLLPLIGQKGTREYRHYTFLMDRWRECKTEVLECDRNIKSACFRTDFIQPAQEKAHPPAREAVFGEKSEATTCPECKLDFDFGRVKRHCRHCLRVVCQKCAPKLLLRENGPRLRLCCGCFPRS